MPSHANPVNWFEIPVTDIQRAKTFYEKILQLELPVTEMNGCQMAWFPMERNQLGAAGTLIEGEGYTPSHAGTLVYINVDAIDPTLEAIHANGGKVLLPRTSIGKFGFIAQFEDTEGNRVALHELADAAHE